MLLNLEVVKSDIKKSPVAGEIRELTNVGKNQNKKQEIRERVCEISEL